MFNILSSFCVLSQIFIVSLYGHHYYLLLGFEYAIRALIYILRNMRKGGGRELAVRVQPPLLSKELVDMLWYPSGPIT